MASWTFLSNRQGWGADDSAWTGDEGRPAGCLVGSQDISGLSISVTPDSPCSFWAKIMCEDAATNLDIGLASNDDLVNISTSRSVPGGSYDSGWFKVFGNASDTGTVTDLGLTIGASMPDWPGIVYFDSVYVAETEPEDSTGLRYLGLAADSGRLYVTGIENGTLSAWQYSLSALGELTSDTFGAAGYTDPDTFTRGLLPQIKVDGQLHLYGRDGSNRQILYNDLNGSAGWVDVGAGTATWGTAKYCVALMPSALDPTVMSAAFYDNDVFTGDHVAPGSVVWEKEGDAPTNLRCGAKHPIEPKILFLAGTAAGTVFQTVNAGFGTYTQIGGTVVTGTINAVEVSR